MKFRNRVAAAAAVLALAGCFGSSQKTNFYTLSTQTGAAQAEKQAAEAAAAEAAAAAGVARVQVSIAQVAIPEIVDRRQLVVRTAPNRVEIAEFHQWAEPLRLGIARVLAEDLAEQLGADFVVLLGQPIGSAPKVRIYLDVQKFEAVQGQSVTVEAIWSARPAKGEPRTGRASVEEHLSADDHAGIAAAYSRALSRVAREVGAAVAALQPN
jgi:uncharacterized lipoprotein YmbA